jgi:hypothetical protein
LYSASRSVDKKCVGPLKMLFPSPIEIGPNLTATVRLRLIKVSIDFLLIYKQYMLFSPAGVASNAGDVHAASILWTLLGRHYLVSPTRRTHTSIAKPRRGKPAEQPKGGRTGLLPGKIRRPQAAIRLDQVLKSRSHSLVSWSLDYQPFCLCIQISVTSCLSNISSDLRFTVARPDQSRKDCWICFRMTTQSDDLHN